LLDILITSKTRVKILLKFFLNPETKTHIRALANELNESANAVRLELNRLLEAKMLTSTRESNRIMFRVNEAHPLYKPVRQMIQQHVGVDEIIRNVIRGLGNINKIYLTGSLAKGLSTDIIDVVLVGEINTHYLLETIEKLQLALSKKIRFVIYSTEEAELQSFDCEDYILIFES
jgi:predicted nucleotidyltransferase